MGKQLFCNNLSASYSTKSVLNNISFELNQGDFICLCGPNGAGKSTFMTILAGLNKGDFKTLSAEDFPSVKYEDGTVTPLSKLKNKETAQLIAYMQQSEYSTWDFSVKELILQGRFAHSKNGWYSQEDYDLVDKLIEDLNLQAIADKTLHSISGGEFQKVRIARALAQTPDFMLLDEPAAGLDFVYEPQLLTQLKAIAEEKNIGILLSIHDINLAARFAHKIALLAPEKPLLCDTVDTIFTSENLSSAFNAKLSTYTHPIYNKVQVLYDER